MWCWGQKWFSTVQGKKLQQSQWGYSELQHFCGTDPSSSELLWAARDSIRTWHECLLSTFPVRCLCCPDLAHVNLSHPFTLWMLDHASGLARLHAQQDSSGGGTNMLSGRVETFPGLDFHQHSIIVVCKSATVQFQATKPSRPKWSQQAKDQNVIQKLVTVLQPISCQWFWFIPITYLAWRAFGQHGTHTPLYKGVFLLTSK